MIRTAGGPASAGTGPLPADPPEEPPPGVAGEILWRLAVRLHRDHGAVVADEGLVAGTAHPADDPTADARTADARAADNRADDRAADPTADDRPVCRRCRQPWPCSGRRLAELGLITAAR